MELVARRRRIAVLAFGEILDDAHDERPGARSARERGVARAPGGGRLHQGRRAPLRPRPRHRGLGQAGIGLPGLAHPARARRSPPRAWRGWRRPRPAVRELGFRVLRVASQGVAKRGSSWAPPSASAARPCARRSSRPWPPTGSSASSWRPTARRVPSRSMEAERDAEREPPQARAHRAQGARLPRVQLRRPARALRGACAPRSCPTSACTRSSAPCRAGSTRRTSSTSCGCACSSAGGLPALRGPRPRLPCAPT